MLNNMMWNFLTRPDFIACKYEDREMMSIGLCKKLWRPQMFYWVVRNQETVNQLADEDGMVIFEGFAAK